MTEKFWRTEGRDESGPLYTGLKKLSAGPVGKAGIGLAALLAAQNSADAATPESVSEQIATRVYVTSGQRADLIQSDAGGRTDVEMNPDENLAVVWMSKNFRCENGTPVNPEGGFRVPAGTALSCDTEQGQGVMKDITSVTAKVSAPLQSGNYSFGVDGCDECDRNISVSVTPPVLTEETGYTRPVIDEKIKSDETSENCCDLSGGLIMKPDIGSSTATAGYGVNMEFQARPHEYFGVGLQYSYSVADVWLNPELQRGSWTDNTHPEHLHQIHAKGVFTAPVITGDHDWLRLEAGGLLGGSIWHYENMPYDQYQGDLGNDAYSWQVISSQNQTRMTFDVGATAGARFYPHKNVMLQLGVDAITNVNGHDRIRGENSATYVEPENDEHDLRLDVRANLGVSF